MIPALALYRRNAEALGRVFPDLGEDCRPRRARPGALEGGLQRDADERVRSGRSFQLTANRTGPSVRYYLMSGLSHGVGDATTKSTCQQFLNPVSPYRAHRALLLALDRWVSDGTKPPKSRVPEGGHRAFAVTVPGSQTGVVPQEELGWPNIPGVLYTGVITTRYFLDFGPDFDNGILSNYPPSVVGRPSYPIFVSKVDDDGNEIAGVRLPGSRHRLPPRPDGRCGQPRPEVTTAVKRMASTSRYVKAVGKAAQKLQKDGFLLADDVQRFIDEAEASNVLK